MWQGVFLFLFSKKQKQEPFFKILNDIFWKLGFYGYFTDIIQVRP